MGPLVAYIITREVFVQPDSRTLTPETMVATAVDVFLRGMEIVQLDGDKVKATIFFRGREMAHPEIGRRILERLVDELKDVAIAETMPRMEGNQMHTILSRRPQTGGGKAKPAAAKMATPSVT